MSVLSFATQFVGGKDWTKAECEEHFKATDTSHDGKISEEEFQVFSAEQTQHIDSVVFQAMIHSFTEVQDINEKRRGLILNVYDKIDVQKKGHINKEDMKLFGHFMNPKFDNDRLEKLMTQMDLTKSGGVDKNEFLGYFAKLSKSTADKPFESAMTKYAKFDLQAAKDKAKQEANGKH